MTRVDGQDLNNCSDEHVNSDVAEVSVVDKIRRLAEGQPFGVLCTQIGGQPYGSMIALAFTEDLSHAVFSTPRATRKYRNLSECNKIAIVVNNLSEFPDELMSVSAFTLTGQACEVVSDEEHSYWAGLLLGRHPELRDFVESPSTAVFRVKVIRYFFVSSFQEVTQWTPDPSGN
jgi:hypothetical protein